MTVKRGIVAAGLSSQAQCRLFDHGSIWQCSSAHAD